MVLSIDVDLEAPQLTLKDERQDTISVSNMLSDEYMLNLVEAADNSGYVDLTLSRPLTYRKDEPYNVVYCAKDKFGNVSTLSVTYQLKD